MEFTETEHTNNDTQDWPTVDVWVWLYVNELIPPWITFQRLREEWKKYNIGLEL